MYYYEENGQCFAACQPLPLTAAEGAAEQPVFLFRRGPESGRAAFYAVSLSQLTAAAEDVSWLDSRRISVTQAAGGELRPSPLAGDGGVAAHTGQKARPHSGHR